MLLCIVFLAVAVVSDFDRAQDGRWGVSCPTSVMLSPNLMTTEECAKLVLDDSRCTTGRFHMKSW